MRVWRSGSGRHMQGRDSPREIRAAVQPEWTMVAMHKAHVFQLWHRRSSLALIEVFCRPYHMGKQWLPR
jgi:hypothetical protein